MTTHDSALSDLAARLAGADASLSTSLRDILTAALQELIEAELTGMIGAAPGERSPERIAQRNGHRPKLLSTPAGDVRDVIAASDQAPASGRSGTCSARSAGRTSSRPG